MKQGRDHIIGCKEVGMDELVETNKTLNGTSNAITNTFGVGIDGLDESAARTYSNFTSHSLEVPTMRVSPKLHKKIGEDGSPKTRAIVGAGSCLEARALEVISDVIDAFVEDTENIECNSTEDMLNKMNTAEKLIEDEVNEIVIGSGDMVGLYLSIMKKVAGQDVYEMIMESKVKVQNVNLKLLYT